MPRPGITVTVVDTPPPRTAPSATDVAFVVGITAEGPTGPSLATGQRDFARRYGGRIPQGVAADSLEAYYREGGARAYFSRVFGPAATAASATLNDADATASLRVSAMSPGVWGNDLHVQVATVTGGFQITVRRGGVTLDQSPTLADNVAALDWGVLSPWVDVTVAGAGDAPAPITDVALAGGDDDFDGITDDDWLAALARFPANLGPGQVLAPGATSAAVQAALLDHARDNNRMAILDAPNTAVVAALVTAATTARGASPDGARFGSLWAPWVRLPGIAGGTTRTVPPSPIVAGLIARNDAAGVTIGTPAANRNGITRSLRSLVASFTDDDMETLYDAGVNLLRQTFLGLVAYGDTSLVDRDADPNWGGFAANRVVMTVASRGAQIMDRHVFDPIDGRGLLQATVAGDLTAMLQPLYDAGALYGATFADAASVDAGNAINTPDTIANRELHAVVSIRTSNAAEMLDLELVRVAVTEALA